MNKREPFKSQRLRRLLTTKKHEEEASAGEGEGNEESNDGLMPYLDDAISEFEMLIVWKKVAGCED